ncbi:hypothetical protein ACQQ2Q_22310 [Agrobacterium sp. ES01]|uniref:hypothetical protein n=1 Tax=Agrobacterium sp. ES01 TaxID=3420714 RepID=UPI003D0C1617
MTEIPPEHQFKNAQRVCTKRDDPYGQKFQAVTSPAKAIRPGKLLSHGFPCKAGRAFAIIAFGHEPYAVYPIGLQDRDGFLPFPQSAELSPTGDREYPWELIAKRPFRNIRDVIDEAETWVRIKIDGQPAVSNRR